MSRNVLIFKKAAHTIILADNPWVVGWEKEIYKLASLRIL
jgi:hypothetical protein